MYLLYVCLKYCHYGLNCVNGTLIGKTEDRKIEEEIFIPLKAQRVPRPAFLHPIADSSEGVFAGVL